MKGFATLKAVLSSRSRQQTLSAKLNRLSLWLGRLVIAFNNLEYALAYEVTYELIELMGQEESKAKHPLGLISPTQRRISDSGLNDMVMASMSFGQKLDLLVALSLKKFPGPTKQEKHIRLIAAALSEAEEYRNKMLHSVWTEDFADYSQVKARTKGRKGLKIQKANTNIPHIQEAIKAINMLGDLGLFAMTHEAIVDETDEGLFRMSKVFQKS